MYHKAVLLKESVDSLCIDTTPKRKNGIYVDATLGGGGHTSLILSKLGEAGKLIVFDQDADAIKNAPEDERIIAIQNNFRFIANYIDYIASKSDIEELKIDGVIADLGVSSHQFDTAERGFSYRFDSQLDMRMNSSAKIDAKEIIKTYSKENLQQILREYGELENASQVASCIYAERERIDTSRDLAEVLRRFYNANSERKFLGKIFQALRIEVNAEMDALKDLLAGCEKKMEIGGRIAIITYHSLEDRIVKNFFREGQKNGTLSIVNKKPIIPCEQEITDNRRSRSAKLRVAEKRG